MASSGSVFSQTLQTITTTKLEELAKQRNSYEERYNALLAVAEAESDPLQRLSLLVDGAKSCLGIKTAAHKNKGDGRTSRVVLGGSSNRRLETDIKNLDRLLEQARYDPTVSPKLLADWQNSILQYLSVQSTKYQYADLYGKLVTEWLSSETTSTDGDAEMGDSFEELPGAKKLEARTEWEKSVFEASNVDVPALNDYLQNLFSTENKDVSDAIHSLHDKVEHFENTMTGSSQFSVETLRGVIQGLQHSDLFSNEKREVLKDFLTNNIILAEVADVLNMRMAALERWTWGDHVPVEQRRKLNGNYSINMDEDLIQAIFLHYIGIRWSVFFKKAFSALRAEVFKSNRAEVHKDDRKRRAYYVGARGVKRGTNMHDERFRNHRDQYFVHQLLDHEFQQIEVQEGEEEAEPEKFGQSLKKRKTGQPKQTQQGYRIATQKSTLFAHAPSGGAQVDSDDEDMGYGLFDADDNAPKLKKPMEAKQGLLHLLSTEIVVNTRLHGELTCFRSVFESFNPLLPHETALAVLTYFGVSESWTTFFRTFLQAPLKFMDDGSSAPRLRRRGTPESHALSDVFGEVTLFCLDFSVNQSADGGLLHRMYDDFWFWSPDYEKSAAAWASVLEFIKATGTQLSDTKTGSVRIARGGVQVDLDERLPEGEIRWGFLYLHPTTGRFEINQKMVDSHVEELRTQLASKSTSVIDWIQAWNTYAATFFSSNFGTAANCFGREHIDNMLATHRRIQESLFESGNVVQFLKKTIEERFAVKDIPDGFLFFPVELGGLDLKSPFVSLLQIRASVKENPYNLIDEFEEAELKDYQKAKRYFDSVINGHETADPNWKPDQDPDTFFSFEEYVRYREDFEGVGIAQLVDVYRQLQRRPNEESINVSVQVMQALTELRGQNNLRGITENWNSMEAYWKWIAEMYGPEMVEKFGGLNVVDTGLLPTGMVSVFRQKRTKWQD